MAYKLPVVTIENQQFTVDDRLVELRPNETPWSPVRFDSIRGMWDYLTRHEATVVEPFQRIEDGKLIPCNDGDRFSWLCHAADWTR